VLAVLTGCVYALCAFSAVFGLVVIFGLGLPAFGEGHTVNGAAVTVCGALGFTLGLAGLIGLARHAKRRP
jgi:hypothetical protein